MEIWESEGGGSVINASFEDFYVKIFKTREVIATIIETREGQANSIASGPRLTGSLAGWVFEPRFIFIILMGFYLLLIKNI